MEPVTNRNLNPFFKPHDEKKTEKAKGNSKTGFKSTLETQKSTEVSLERIAEDEIGKLLDEVFESGASLVGEPGVRTAQNYRQAVGKFLEAIVQHTFTTETHTGHLRKDHSRPQYTLLRNINAKLESLVTAVLQGQKDQMELLRKTDELRGLLIDLRH